MEPFNTSANNMEFLEGIDDHLEKVVQDFNGFRERIAQASFNGDMKLEDLIDLYIGNHGEGFYNMPETNGVQVTALPEDFNKFESTILPQQGQPEHAQSINGFNIDRQIQESEKMTQEMTEDTSQNDTGSFPDSSQTVNINSHVGVVSSSSRVTNIRYGDLNGHEAADGIIGSVFGSSIESVFGSVKRMSIWSQVGLKEKGDRTNRRKRVKRKHREVIDTDEETARPMEIPKIKNREAAAKEHANRQAGEVNIRSQL